MQNRFTPFTVATLVASLLAGPAGGQVHYVGYTAGCFGPGCVPLTTPSAIPGSAGGSLTFHPAYPSQSMTSGIDTYGVVAPYFIATLGGDPFDLATPFNFNNFGSFELQSVASPAESFGGPTGTPFTLEVTLTSPVNDVDQWTALVNGTVGMVGGNLFVTFADFLAVNPLDVLSYLPFGTSSVRLFVDHTQLGPTGLGGVRHEAVTGALATVPEPSTYTLLASGLAALVGLARRRRHPG